MYLWSDDQSLNKTKQQKQTNKQNGKKKYFTANYDFNPVRVLLCGIHLNAERTLVSIVYICLAHLPIRFEWNLGM